MPKRRFWDDFRLTNVNEIVDVTPIDADRPNVRMTVIVPTYRRTHDLGRCLDALGKQDRSADRVIVVCQEADDESKVFLERRRETEALAFDIVYVAIPGQVAALNAALEKVQGEIVCFTDDDAAPRADWLARIEKHFAEDLKVGGVGGRDYIACEKNVRPMKHVGIIEWFGRPIGNHHSGTGPARSVDVLKGSNMSFRLSAIEGVRFDERLRGAGAQRNNDLAFSLAVRKRGWKIIYDPAVAVDHYPGDRPNGLDRSELSKRAVHENAYNETLAILAYLPPMRRPIFLLWSVLVGTRVMPGLVQSIWNTLKQPSIWGLFVETVKARFGAAQTLRASGRDSSA